MGKIRFRVRDNVRTMFPDRNVVLGSTILTLINIQPGLLTVYTANKNIA